MAVLISTHFRDDYFDNSNVNSKMLCCALFCPVFFSVSLYLLWTVPRNMETTAKPDLVPQMKPAAWGGCCTAPPCSLNDVMSETMAQQLQLSELQDVQRHT